MIGDDDHPIKNPSYSLPLDPASPYSAWMIVSYEGQWYIYNVGARQFLVVGETGGIQATTLQDTPLPVTIAATDDGLFTPDDGVPTIGGGTVTLDGISSYLRVDLPEGWTWAQAGGTPTGTVYGLWPEADPDFKVELHYWPEKFAMCGTGVTIQDYTLPNGEKATLAYERIGDGISWVLILPEAPDSFTIQFAVPYSLYESHRAELELLLGTIRQGVLAHPDVVTPETSAD